MEQPITIGIDLAKNVFQVHGVGAGGQVVLRRKLRRAHLQPPVALPDRHGGLRGRASLGAGARRAWP